MRDKNTMLQINDFKVGQKAYIFYRHLGYNQPPEIIETTVIKTGRKYVTVSHYKKQFKRHGNIDGLIEHNDYGELGILFNTKESAELNKKREISLHNIRICSKYLYKCTYEELRTIMNILKLAGER